MVRHLHRSSIRWTGLAWLVIWLHTMVSPTLLAVQGPVGLQAGPPSDWEVMAVLIPADPELQRQYIPRMYIPIEIEDLDSKLRQEQQRRRDKQFRTPVLVDAQYVARIDGDLLVSDNSRWRFRGGPRSSPLNLGQISVAMRDARSTADSQLEQLSTYQSFLADGSLELNVAEAIADRWFGFSTSARPTEVGYEFSIRLPAATVASLLVSTARNETLFSSDTVVEALENIEESISSGDWPSGLVREVILPSNRRWWRVHLSGCSQFSLQVHSTLEEASLVYRHSLRSQETDYTLAARQLEMRTVWQVASTSRGIPLQLRLGQELRIKSLLINGAGVDWRSIPSPTQDENWIEVVDQPLLKPGAQIQLTATAEHTALDRLSLPAVAIDRAWCIRGLQRLRAATGLSIDVVQANGSSLTPEVLPTLGARPGELVWSGRWTGQAPKLAAVFSPLKTGWNVETLNRFNVQSAWISASARLALTGNHLRSNELRLLVNPEWFIDSVQLISDSEGDIRAQLVENNHSDTRRSEIIISWERERSEIRLDLELAAHSPKEEASAGVILDKPRLAFLPAADQSDVYAISSTGRFRVQPTAELLDFQLLPRQLPAWQQPLIPPSSDTWIFGDSHQGLPPIRLVASGGTYTIGVHTFLPQQTQVTPSNSAETSPTPMGYIIDCRPVSGSVDRLRLLLPSSIDTSQLSFELLELDAESSVPLAWEPSGDSVPADDYCEGYLAFPSPRTNPCKIRGRWLVDTAAGNQQIPILCFPDAVSSSSLLLIPKAMASFVGQPQLELLPVNACCSADDAWLFENELEGAEPEAFTAARLDAGEPQVVTLQPFARLVSSGWIWLQVLDHYVWDDGSAKYRIQWDLETSDSSQLEFQLPDSWRLERVSVSGETNVVEASLFQTYRLPVPTHRRTQVVIECSQATRYARPPVLAELSWDTSRLSNLPVFQSRQRVHLPPGTVAFSGFQPSSDSSGRLMDRLLPWRWWSLLSPYGEHALAASNRIDGDNGWSVVEWSNGNLADRPHAAVGGSAVAAQNSLWAINRNTLTAFLMAGVVALATLFRLLLAYSTRWWWICLSLVVLATVLIPRQFVPWGQLVLLSANLALLVHCVSWITRLRRVVQEATAPGGQTRVVRRSNLIGGTWGCVLFMIACGTAAGQTSGRPLPSPATNPVVLGAPQSQGSVSPQPSSPALYGVLFPVDADSQIAGPYAYVPSRLWDLLSAPDDLNWSLEPPRVLSANYLLRLRPGSSNAELSVDMRIQATRSETELRLPFRASQLQLVSGQIDGEERLVGLSGLRQEAEQVVLQANRVGTFPVRLQFVTTNATPALQLNASLPSIPNATLRIDSEGLRVAVNAIGGVQRSANGELLANLGPVRELDVSWSEGTRRGLGNPQVEVSSETWVHASGEQLMAACQLRFPRGQGIPSILRVYIDSAWEPVGTSWGEAELMTSETMSFGNRRVYSVRMPDVPFLASTSVATESLIRVLLVPSDAATNAALTIPFLSLQEVSQTATRRSLSWSTSKEPTFWKADGVDFWQESLESLESQESLDGNSEWGEMALADQRRNYRVPGTGPIQLRRQTPLLPAAAEERNILHYSQAEVALEYSARWESRFASSALQLLLPTGGRILDFTVNGKTVPYRISEKSSGNVLLIPNGNQRLNEINAVDMRISLPPALMQTRDIPRVVLRDTTVKSSRLQIYRSSMLDFGFDPESFSLLQRLQLSVPISLLLDSLEVMVGEFELGNSFRDSPWLPVSASVGLAPAAEPKFAVLRLNQTTDGWIANVTASWDPTAQLDFAYFDVPIATRNSLQSGSVARKFMPTADSNRATLCIVPTTNASGERRVSFSFPISDTGSGPSVTVPEVRLLAKEPRPLVLALPTVLDGTAITWQKPGNRISAELLEQIDEPELEGYVFFAGSEVSLQLGWQPSEAEALQARILQRMIHVTDVTPQRTTAVVSYWVMPSGELQLGFQLAENCRVLGVDIGGSAAIWQQPTPHALTVALQPNYLPVRLQLLVDWNYAAGESPGELELPMPQAEQATGDWIASISPEVRSRLGTPRGQSILLPAPSDAMLNAWFELVSDVMQSQSGNQANELNLWLTSWQPTQFGISYDQVLDGQLAALAGSAFDEDRNGSITVGEFWSSLGGTAADAVTTIPMGQPQVRESYWLSQNRLALTAPGVPESWTPRIIAASLLAAASLLVLAVGGGRLGHAYVELLSTRPWLNWLQLAVVALALLPILWPGWLLLALAIGLLASHWVNRRRSSASYPA